MTVFAPAITNIPLQYHGSNAVKVAWGPMLNGDSGGVMQVPDFADRSVQVEGTFGAAGTVVIEGSNDGVTFETLHDQGGTALSFTGAGIKYISEPVVSLRPRVTGGDGTTSLTVTGCFRRQQPQ